jgi:hypothetical protein
MTTRTDRILSALGMSIAGAGVTLQGIGIGATHYQLAIQIIAVVCGAGGMFLQALTRPISEALKKDPPQ